MESEFEEVQKYIIYNYRKAEEVHVYSAKLINEINHNRRITYDL
jgi:hypothetical protein